MARRLLEAGGFTVVGEAGGGASALAAAAALGRDVVLLDVPAAGYAWFAVARRLAERAGRVVVVLTSSRSGSGAGSAARAGAGCGFHYKGRAVRGSVR